MPLSMADPTTKMPLPPLPTTISTPLTHAITSGWSRRLSAASVREEEGCWLAPLALCRQNLNELNEYTNKYFMMARYMSTRSSCWSAAPIRRSPRIAHPKTRFSIVFNVFPLLFYLSYTFPCCFCLSLSRSFSSQGGEERKREQRQSPKEDLDTGEAGALARKG